MIPQKANLGVYIQYNNNMPIVEDLLEIKSSIGYNHFFSKFEGNFYGEEKSYSINKLGISLNFDFLIKKKFIISPGVDFSTYFAKFDDLNLRVGASLSGSYKLSEKLLINLKYIKAFEPIYFYDNKQDIDIVNVGLNYRFR